MWLNFFFENPIPIDAGFQLREISRIVSLAIIKNVPDREKAKSILKMETTLELTDVLHA